MTKAPGAFLVQQTLGMGPRGAVLLLASVGEETNMAEGSHTGMKCFWATLQGASIFNAGGTQNRDVSFRRKVSTQHQDTLSLCTALSATKQDIFHFYFLKVLKLDRCS